ncbi:MAG: PIG-L family deacetylase [Phaeodactylibacter sp.]|uniref:PIG-L family deacetylase n=1 Tax=Phaeodactylibacter sp. TaxID=1940289 RepID=UPI0032EF3533
MMLILMLPILMLGQSPERWTATEIYQGIEKLNFLGSALYVAAHPDDENQRLIAYLANEYNAEMAYLSLTRGDGGQNLIGPEIRELLGVIRTQELLGARRIDGGRQMFTRANDFGYSKHPDETLDIWQREAVLGDVVWAIRKWQPDVIINRFDHESAGRTHGHHTSSAILSYEAFDLAGDPEAYSEQLEYLDPWQPQRLFFNTSWWFYGSQEAFAEADKTNLMSVDIGVYYPMRGKSNNEIAAEARSMHKCQGFGATLQRGTQQEYLKLLKGDMPAGKENLFEGINTTWTRVKGGKAVGAILTKAQEQFDFERPYQAVSALLNAREALQKVEEGYWKQVKSQELDELILACMGLYVEATAEDYSATPGEEIELTMEVVNRSPVNARLKAVTYLPMEADSTLALDLENNQQYEFYEKLVLPGDLSHTNPYWLNEEGTLGMYKVDNQLLRGLPETPRALQVAFHLEVDGTPMTVIRDVVYKETKPSQGETYRPFEVTPPVFANIAEKVYVFAGNGPQEVAVRVRAGKDTVAGKLSLALPEGWRSEPAEAPFEIAVKSGEQLVEFMLFPPADPGEGRIQAVATLKEGTSYTDGLNVIAYDHIPAQTVMLENSAKVVKVDIATAGKQIGYLMGAGDEVPNSLAQIGYEVTLLSDEDITLEQLQQYDAVILGIRAYNTNERMAFHQPVLLEYVKQGGTLINQYNTTRNLKVDMENIAPYHLKISRDRVTVEEAPVRMLAPDHPVLNWPNKITAADFEGWVQERGLYFPNEWGEEFTAVLSSNDPGEDPKDGGLLVAPYGEGYYIYSGYSWFRELPAGVPGAYRLFANLISIGKENR